MENTSNNNTTSTTTARFTRDTLSMRRRWRRICRLRDLSRKAARINRGSIARDLKARADRAEEVYKTLIKYGRAPRRADLLREAAEKNR